MAAPDHERLLGALSRAVNGRDTALAILNGFFGDKLTESASALALGMELRHRGVLLPVDGDLAGSLAAPSQDIVILVHGLMLTEHSFGHKSQMGLARKLERDLGVTALELRYNTGLHISDNGRSLSELLESLLAAWPVEVSSLSLIGHSMGGLVCRSASHQGSCESKSWVEKLRRMFLLGVPSRGAPLEQLINVAAFTLNLIWNPWTRLIGWTINQRSAGIKDLRHGYLVEEEWRDRHADALSVGRRHPVPLVAGVEHYVIAGTVVEDVNHPLAKVFGDAMVTPWSARDIRTSGPDAGRLKGKVRVFPGVGHLSLAQHDGVYEQIRDWW